MKSFLRPFILALFALSTVAHADTNIWPSVRAGFGMPHDVKDPQVQHFIVYYQTHPIIFNGILNASAPYLYGILHAVKQEGFPTEIALLPAIESGYRTEVTSSQGAVGIWQLEPAAANRFHVPMDGWFDGRRDPMLSTQAALQYLQILHHQFQDNWLMALAAYNSGEGVVAGAVLNAPRHSFWALTLPPQTRDYVPKLMAISELVRDPASYHVQLPDIPNHQVFGNVNLNHQVNLLEASHACNASVDTLRVFNPGLLGNTTPPYPGFSLNVPLQDVSICNAGLNGAPAKSNRFHRLHL